MPIFSRQNISFSKTDVWYDVYFLPQQMQIELYTSHLLIFPNAKTNLRWSFSIAHLHNVGSLKRTLNKPLKKHFSLPVHISCPCSIFIASLFSSHFTLILITYYLSNKRFKLQSCSPLEEFFLYTPTYKSGINFGVNYESISMNFQILEALSLTRKQKR